MTQSSLGFFAFTLLTCLFAVEASAASTTLDPQTLFGEIRTSVVAPDTPGASNEPVSPKNPSSPVAPVTIAPTPSDTPTDVRGGPACGDILITKYTCEKGTSVSRDANGPKYDGSHTYPAGCVKQGGARFGYIHEPAVASADYSGPFPGKDDQTPFTPFHGATNWRGQLFVKSLTDPTGRYSLAELDASGTRMSDGDVLGFFCTDDVGEGGDNYAMTFLGETGTDYCVVYNGTDTPDSGTGTSTPPVGNGATTTPPDSPGNGGGSSGGGGGTGGGGPCTNCGDDDDDDGGGGRGDDDDDDSPTINLERDIAGDVDLPDLPKTGTGPGSIFPIVAGMLFALLALFYGSFVWHAFRRY